MGVESRRGMVRSRFVARRGSLAAVGDSEVDVAPFVFAPPSPELRAPSPRVPSGTATSGRGDEREAAGGDAGVEADAILAGPAREVDAAGMRGAVEAGGEGRDNELAGEGTSRALARTTDGRSAPPC